MSTVKTEAADGAPQKPTHSLEVETEALSSNVTTSYDAGTGSAESGTDAGTEYDYDPKDPEDEADGDAAEDSGEGTEEEEGSSDDKDEVPVNDLPDYDPEAENFEEVRAKYDERYFKDGEARLDVISKEYWDAFGKAEGDVSKANLPEGTYKYLEEVTGFSRQAIKQIEKGLVADHQKSASEKVARVGGSEKLNAALKWAKEGGYSEEQRARFNAAAEKGGVDEEDALDALMARYERAAPNKGERRRGPPGRDGKPPNRPQRSATSGAAVGGNPSPDGKPLETFKSLNEYKEAWDAHLSRAQKARNEGDREALKKLDKEREFLQRKARRSPALRK